MATSLNREGNACTRSFTDRTGLALFVEDTNFTDSYPKGGCAPDGNGNVHTAVAFTATNSGWYYIAVYPNGYAANGTYGLRVLPSYDQPGASWDVAMEPNNSSAHAYPLGLERCDVRSNIERRNASFLTNAADDDWFVFSAEQGKDYRLTLDELASTFGSNGVYLELYDTERRLKQERGRNKVEITFKAGYTGIHYARVVPYTASDSGSYRIRIADALSTNCDGSPPPPIIEGGVSQGPAPGGRVIIRAPRTGSTQVTFTAVARCSVGITARDVALTIGSASFAMTLLSEERYRVTITIPDDIPAGTRSLEVSVRFTCNGQLQINPVGTLERFDPSGLITDAATGNPISGATVTLYQVVDARPDTATEQRDCRIISTRGGDNWNNLPPADLARGTEVNPLIDALNGVERITPQMNPQITGSDGGYAWDVIEGCWFVVVSAPGYARVISPMVGVPPAVTDLHIALQAAGTSLYLPLLRR
jgi:hypothetical protein